MSYYGLVAQDKRCGCANQIHFTHPKRPHPTDNPLSAPYTRNADDQTWTHPQCTENN